MSSRVKISLEDVAKKAIKVIIIGVGGGGDIGWAIPIINYLRLFKAKEFFIGEPGIGWWNIDGRIALGGFKIQIKDLDKYKRISKRLALIDYDTKVINGAIKGMKLPQSIVAELMKTKSFILELDEGVDGMVEELKMFIKKEKIDLIIGVDCGSDSFYSGVETKVLSPLVDAMVVAMLARLDIPSVLSLIGYGCDGDLMPEELDKSISLVMKKGGFLGARGLTPIDIEYMEKFFNMFPNPVEEWPLKAAKGELGWKRMNELWSIKISPFTSIMLFFDPKILLEHNPLAKKILYSKSLKEAENITLKLGLIPETRMVKLLPSLLEGE
ncbi:MAG: DUF1152 domain-containing protein [Candidatus Bathyarchaeia archaeon]